MKQIHILLGSALPVLTGQPSSRDERGLSQSTENAVLLLGAVAIATLVVSVITGYVSKHLPK